MTVELLLVLLLQTEDDLHRARPLRYFAWVSNDDIGSIPNGNGTLVHRSNIGKNRSPLENVGSDVFSCYWIFGNAFLVAAHLISNVRSEDKKSTWGTTNKTEDMKSAFVDLAAAVRYDTHNNFLPTIWSPRLWLVPRAKVCDVLDHAGESKYLSMQSQRPILTYAFIVLVNRISSSLYIVMTMNNSVSRPIKYGRRE